MTIYIHAYFCCFYFASVVIRTICVLHLFADNPTHLTPDPTLGLCWVARLSLMLTSILYSQNSSQHTHKQNCRVKVLFSFRNTFFRLDET